MVQKVHGYSAPGNKTGKELNYYKIRTLLNITPTGVVDILDDVNPMGVYPFTFSTDNESDGGVTYASAQEYNDALTEQERFNLLIQTISLRAQPILLGGVLHWTQPKSTVTDLPAVDNVAPWASMTPTDMVDLYEVNFAIEHNLAWEPVGNQPNLAESLDGVMDFSYANPSDPNNNVYVEFLGNLLR